MAMVCLKVRSLYQKTTQSLDGGVPSQVFTTPNPLYVLVQCIVSATLWGIHLIYRVINLNWSIGLGPQPVKIERIVD